MDFINKLSLTGEQKKYLNKLNRRIKNVMPEKLYKHSMNTLEFANDIAEKTFSNLDLFGLSVACILHDYGKIFSYEELVEIVKKNKLKVSDFELNNPEMLHSFIGDYLVSRDFNIYEKKILKSIKFHTIGYCDMRTEDKILFISDKIEKGRIYKGVECLRESAFKNLNLCLLEIYKNTMIYIVKGNKLLHPDTSKIWNNICGGI